MDESLAVEALFRTKRKNKDNVGTRKFETVKVLQKILIVI